MKDSSGAQKIFNNSILYALGSVGTKAIGFLLVPIYTYNVSSEDYGIATTITTFTATFGILIMLSLESSMIRFYNEYEGEDRKRFVGTITLFVLFNALFVCGLLCLFRTLYMDKLFFGIDFYPIVLLGIIALSANGIYLVYQSMLRSKQDGKNYSINSLLYVFVHALLVVLFVALLKMSATGMVLSNCITNILFALYGLLSMHKKGLFVFAFDKEKLIKSLKYSIPIIPHDIFNSLDNYLIKLVINRYIGYATSGLYTLASQFSMMFNVVAASVNLAFRPWFFEQLQYGETGRALIKQMTCMIMALYTFAAVIISSYCKEIVTLMSAKEYIDAWKLVPLFIIAQLLTFIYYSHIQSAFYNLKKSKFITVSSLSSCASDVIFSLLLVGTMNIRGILIAQIISKAVLATVAVVLNNKAEKVDFGLKTMLMYIFISCVLIAISSYISYIYTIGIKEVLLKLVVVVIAYFVLMHRYHDDFGTLITGVLKKSIIGKGKWKKQK